MPAVQLRELRFVRGSFRQNENTCGVRAGSASIRSASSITVAPHDDGSFVSVVIDHEQRLRACPAAVRIASSSDPSDCDSASSSTNP
jgi:hypothetical protein